MHKWNDISATGAALLLKKMTLQTDMFLLFNGLFLLENPVMFLVFMLFSNVPNVVSHVMVFDLLIKLLMSCEKLY